MHAGQQHVHTFPVSVCTPGQQGVHFGPAPTIVGAGESDRLSKRWGTDATYIGVEKYYIHTDHLNTPRRISRASDNQIVWRWDNGPFGRHTANEDPDGDSQLFTFSLRYPGQCYDEETGLHYNYFRDYDPNTGRYIESDPIGLEGGLNTYKYVRGNPLSYFDSKGLFDVYATEFSKGRYVYKFDFAPKKYVGMVNEYKPFSPSKNVNRAKKVCERLGLEECGPISAGLSDVEGASKNWRCLGEEEKLHGIFRNMGFRDGMFTGTQLTEEQAYQVIDKFKNALPNDVSRNYDLDTIIDRARSRAVKAVTAY